MRHGRIDYCFCIVVMYATGTMTSGMHDNNNQGIRGGMSNNNNKTVTTNSGGSKNQSGVVDASPPEEEEDITNYLYHNNYSYPIIDYEPPSSSKESIIHDKPLFLFGENQPARVVEFYAPWCPHCQDFRYHYIQFARQVRSVLLELNGNTTTNTTIATTINQHPPNDKYNVQFYAISCTKNQKLCHQFGVHGFPKIKLFPAGAMNYTSEVMYWKVHPFDVLSKLNIHIDTSLRLEEVIATTEIINKKIGTSRSNHHPNDNNTSWWPVRTKKQVYDDAYLSFVFSMRNGIFTSEDQPLQNKTQNALKDWLELLQKTLPIGWNPIHTIVYDILYNFDVAIQSESNFTSILDHAISKISNSGSSSNDNKWSPACTRGKPGMGYTCGLWELFHIMTVGVVEYNLLISDESDDGTLYDIQISTSYAAETLRNFIQEFFGCTECKYNFLKHYDACGHDHCTRFDETNFSNEQWIQLPVWLFETHNSVNVRLFKEAKERNSNKNIALSSSSASFDDEIHHRQWPPRHICPKCWSKTDEFNEEFVFKFLRTEYWPEDAVSTKYREEIAKVEEDYPSDDDITESKNNTESAFISFLRYIQYFFVGTTFGFTLTWYLKSLEKKRSGRHKKIDY